MIVSCGRSHFRILAHLGGETVKAIWVLFGLTPALLFIKGFLMWWNRVLAPALKRKPVVEPPLNAAVTSD